MSNRTGGDGFALVAARHAMTSSETSSENYGALPSSYRRRIRKSRSLATVHQPSNLRLRIQRSVPFLRRQNTTIFHKNTEPVWERHNEAVQLAREQYFSRSSPRETQNSEQQRLQRNEVKEHCKIRTSVRPSLITDAIPPPPTKRSSSLTSSIRKHVRKVISRSWSKKDSLPPQQVQAQDNYFSEFEQDVGPVRGFDAYQDVEDTSQESDSYPAVPDNDFAEDMDRFPYTLASSASRESLHSNARSRVTSWTNSSMTDSVGPRSGAIEPNRLSIIREDGGPHHPSSSAGKHIGGVVTFHGPLQPATNDVEAAPAIDSQRIYSALMKRINEEEAAADKSAVNMKTVDHDFEESNQELHRRKSTIRAVHSESSLATLTLDRHNKRLASDSGSSGIDRAVSGTIVEIRQKETIGKQRDRLVEQESQSSFFPFSSEKSPDTPSPSRNSSMKGAVVPGARSRSSSRYRNRNCNQVDEADDGSVIVNRQSSNPIMNRSRFGFSSASVYSQTTDGGTNECYHRPIESSEELRAGKENSPPSVHQEDTAP